jgi:FAD/FMN-containing dehydrogenase
LPVACASTPMEHEETRTLRNWGRTFEFRPAVVVEAQTAGDVVRVVKDPVNYPTPVRALGSIHSVSEVVVNEGGTVVLMRALKGVLGLSADAEGQVVTVQAGITLLELHTWLGERQLEMAVAPEIGDATVGSLVGSVSKDGGVGDPTETGTLYKAITGVKYVDHNGEIVSLTRKENPTELAEFKCRLVNQ